MKFHDANCFQIARKQWSNVFFLSAEIYAFGALIFLILGSGKKQWWADGPSANNAECLQ